jgi:hypothetical protein
MAYIHIKSKLIKVQQTVDKVEDFGPDVPKLVGYKQTATVLRRDTKHQTFINTKKVHQKLPFCSDGTYI